MYSTEKVLIRPKDKSWFNSELRYNIRLRDRLMKKACITIMNSLQTATKSGKLYKKTPTKTSDTIDDILSNSETDSKSFGK